MNRPRINSLTLRAGILRLLGVTVFTAILLLALAVLVYESRTYQPRVTAEVATQLDVVSLNIQSALDFSDRESALESLRTLGQDNRFISASVYDRNGDMFVEYYPPNSRRFSAPKVGLNDSNSEFAGNLYRAKSVIKFESDTLGYIVAYYRLPDLWQRLPQYLIMTGVVAVSLIFVAVFLFISVERIIALPVRQLAERARNIAADDNLPAQRDKQNEIKQLESEFERMLLALDIRERRLREQQSRMHFALGAAEQGVWEFDAKTGVIRWDDFLFALHGINKTKGNTLTLNDFMDIVPTSEHDKISAVIKNAYEERLPITVEYAITHRQKGSRIIQSAGKVEADELTGRLLMRGVSRDVTERVQAEYALRVSETRSRSLFEQSPVAIATADVNGNILFCNKRFINTFGYHQDQLPNIIAWTELAYPDAHYRQLVMSEWNLRCAEVLERNLPFRPMDAWISCANGASKCIEFHLSVVGNELIVSFIDLTDRKRAENEILELNAALEERVRLRTEELEVANRELESFSYSVSHDLRAPLRAINGFGTALRADYAEVLDEDGRNYLDRMLAASTRMSVLIDDLLRFSRLSRTAVIRAPINMNDLFMEVWSELKEANIGTKTDVSFGELDECHADRSLLKQVVFNLLNNAVKFSRNSTPARVDVFCQHSEDETIYVVRDNGVGFNMDYADKLFGVFQRLHRSEEFEGTGVGLALCRRVIERHGGRIWAESSPGQGATFFFTLGRPEVDQ